MSSAVVSPSSFDVSNVSISALKLLPSGAKQAYLNYDSRKLTMQVGSLPVPYGMSIFDKAGPIKYSVDLSLRGYEGENPKAKAVFDTFSALDEYMIQQGVKNSKTWFKQDLSRDVVKAFYTPCLRFSKDAEGNPKPYPPTIKVSLKHRDDKFETRVYDDKKREITELPMDEILVKGANITVLIECTGGWFAGSKYGISWKAVQIRVDSLPDRIRGFAFVDDGDATVPSTTTSAPKNRASAPAPNTFQALAADDEEEIDDEEVFAAAAPAPSSAPARTAAAASAAAAAAAFDDEADDVAPVAVPKKVTTVKKVVTKVAVAKK